MVFKDLGFDAIWISPIVDNYDNGYHGYWARKIYEVNSHFGTKDDLKRLVTECHKRDIWVMVDVVGNHVKIINYFYIFTFLLRWGIQTHITVITLHLLLVITIIVIVTLVYLLFKYYIYL